MQTDLKALQERVEAASGPDRELDALLWNFVDTRPLESDGTDTPAIYKRCPDDPIAFDVPPIYTASLDAALALVEELLPDWQMEQISWAPEKGGRVCAGMGNFGEGDAYLSGNGEPCSTPALAVLSALLRAMIAGDHNGR